MLVSVPTHAAPPNGIVSQLYLSPEHSFKKATSAALKSLASRALSATVIRRITGAGQVVYIQQGSTIKVRERGTTMLIGGPARAPPHVR